MGRSFFGFTLLICLLLGSLWLSHSADNQLLPLADQLEQAANAAMEVDMARSISLAQAAYRQWDQLWDPVASYANHTPMDEADQLFAQLSCWEDSPSRYAAICRQLASVLEAMAEAQQISWRNFL